jgi:hypothetical protein
MPRTIALTATHHDPQGLLAEQTTRVLPLLRELYGHITVVLTSSTSPHIQSLLRAAQISLSHGETALPETLAYLGWRRRKALELALGHAPTATHLHLCDFDRILHWATYYPDELRALLDTISHSDFTVLGRTARAFASHPRVQRDTEAIINHAFSLASGLSWDVTAASRGLSRRAAERIVAGCQDDTIGNDCSWPLFLQQQGDLKLQYVQTEGLEFETLDRCSPEELEALGGPTGWLERMDHDPAHWRQRLEIAHIEVASIVAYRANEQKP